MLLKEQRRRSSLASKIRAMESKLLAGSAADRADETKRALELKHQEVIEQKVNSVMANVVNSGSSSF